MIDGHVTEADLERAERVASAAWSKVDVAQRLEREATNRAIKAETRITHALLALRRHPPDVTGALIHLEGRARDD
jgi:hypothetical protein